ncbi:1-deoxy-D-xylulose 5-phosphate reductoisomerase [Caldalkalibacillus thermarum TA2.A1]|uniref:1-deoxy-D-xylulose 5-phosphate reductoisomerase n=1 Tax=Caldalkalibacillus thermarum (strain TA2.A1) TaxID=986075 RepID=F5L4K6_CALTT|nr:1-deoxy-D-xylulose-5-phosphate reductoisomerase [Caldalkalibacillus thermarum]EGL83723.1 1-deoxy-D-xylulose 5-phosphate reductoisomerase [Caldalkalibacillus thermarum TA2.A1]QZT32990.1 1-deoxy-D-xylulose-5-phosphate reductoisomerase [Caldalkalibacillus thermarum TA2.A1]
MKNIAVLGSTGSIGRQTLEIIAAHPDAFKLVAIAGGTNVDLIIEQANRFKPALVSVSTKELAEKVKIHIPEQTKVVYGLEGLIEVSIHEDVHTLVTAVVGSIGLRPTLAAIEQGKQIALANKETLVTAGQIVMETVDKHGAAILPVDSEHSAIFQCLQGENSKQVEKIILTASGGSFRHKSREELVNVTVEDALKHPNWSMGRKVTIDSATMMNKGLEVIEAHWLFSMPYEKIEVLLHDESIIHSMVVFQDSAVMAQLGTPDMKVPIQYALTYPDRFPLHTPRLDLAQIGRLHFREADFNRYPCLRLAFEAGKTGGTMPTVLNAANEIAVTQFLRSEIGFLEIEKVIERTMEQHDPIPNPTLEEIEEIDRWARERAKTLGRRC